MNKKTTPKELIAAGQKTQVELFHTMKLTGINNKIE